jgi:hypothetical protein
MRGASDRDGEAAESAGTAGGGATAADGAEPAGTPSEAGQSSELPEYGETWTYESIVGALPGVHLPGWEAVALQVVLFETVVLVVGVAYGVQAAILPGTVAVAVAAAGSVAMRRLGRGTRAVGAPAAYRRLLFGSSIEVVLGVLAYAALVSYLFVYAPGRGGETLLTRLFGPSPPVVPVYLALLVLWDLCYRIGTSWWAAVVALWRSLRYRVDPETRRRFRRLDALNVGFGLTQLALVPFLLGEPALLFAVVGHVVAVAVVSTAAALSLRTSATG